VKKAVEYTGLTLAIILVIIAALVYLAPHLGWYVDAVVSGSMEPALKIGSMVVTQPVAPEDIEEGDIITFRPTTSATDTVTHRVIKIRQQSPLLFSTKGDANPVHDPFLITGRDIIGKVRLHLPYAGYVTEFLKTIPGFVISIIIPGCIVIIVYICAVWKVINKKKMGEVTGA
jgi:signal peptidase